MRRRAFVLSGIDSASLVRLPLLVLFLPLIVCIENDSVVAAARAENIYIIVRLKRFILLYLPEYDDNAFQVHVTNIYIIVFVNI